VEQIQLKAVVREGRGKQAAKRLRKIGQVPANVYHRGQEPVSVALDAKELNRILHAHAGENILINLTIEKDKKKARAVIIKEMQSDPVKRNVLHVDFNEISLTELITVDVEIVAKGEAIGVKQDGGSLEHVLREVKVQCLPTDIPKHFTVDVSGLKLNDAIHVSDLKVDAKIKIISDPDILVFQVKKHEEKVEDETAVAPELEVIREKKEEEGAPAAKDKEAAPKAEKK
jgi:large subunit ribosomal protein L25